MRKDLKQKNEKLRIAMLGHKRIPSREGGVEVVVEELSIRIAGLGHSVTCYNRSGHHVCGKEYNMTRTSKKPKYYKGIRLKSVPTINRRGLAAMTSSVTASICAALGPYDVVHFHAEGPSFMCWLPKLFGKKVIVTVHGLDHQRAKWGKLARIYIMMGERNAVRFADEMIVLSEGTRKYFLDTYGRNTQFIPNGMSRDEILQAQLIKESFGLDKDGYILFLGRIVPEKGLHYLIEAFQKVKTKKKLVIAGGSSDTDRFMEELKKAAQNDTRILFIGFMEGRKLKELYSNAYLYILPSDLEGMSLSLLEAMSYGNCCLVSDIPECAEVVEDKAITFQKSNTEDLREKLQELCDKPSMVQKYKSIASDFICSKYSWDDMVDKTLELYWNMLGEKNTQSASEKAGKAQTDKLLNENK